MGRMLGRRVPRDPGGGRAAEGRGEPALPARTRSAPAALAADRGRCCGGGSAARGAGSGAGIRRDPPGGPPRSAPSPPPLPPLGRGIRGAAWRSRTRLPAGRCTCPRRPQPGCPGKFKGKSAVRVVPRFEDVWKSLNVPCSGASAPRLTFRPALGSLPLSCSTTPTASARLPRHRRCLQCSTAFTGFSWKPSSSWDHFFN